MRIEFAQFTRWDQVEIAAMAMEIAAGVSGSCLLEDIPIDADQIFTEMLQNPEEFGIETEVERLIEEDFEGRQLAREKFGYRVSEILEFRKRTLSSAYPFELDIGSEPNLTRYNVNNINSFYFAAFALTLFLLLEDREVVQITERDCQAFKTKFHELFELISAIALSVNVEGMVWWTGQTRGRRNFLKQLHRIVRIAGYGEVKPEDQLEDNQLHVNDGGADAIGISTHDGIVEADAICWILGATCQKSSREDKIVGEPDLMRFKNFFVNIPTMAFLGILSIPYNATPAEAQDCRDRNCVYFPLEVIERNLGIASTKEYSQGVLPYIQALNKRMHQKLALAVNDLEIVKAGAAHRVADQFS